MNRMKNKAVILFLKKIFMCFTIEGKKITKIVFYYKLNSCYIVTNINLYYGRHGQNKLQLLIFTNGET